MAEVLAKALNMVILVFLLSTMFSTGLSLTLRQIFEPLRNARLLISSLVANYIMVPLIAIVIVRLVIPLEVPLRIGMVLFSMAAGAEAGPKLTGIAKGNVAFSVGLLVAQLAFTILYIPFVLYMLLPEVHLGIGKLLIKLLLGVFLPLSLGLFLKGRFEAFADRLSPYAHKTSTIFMALMAVGLILLNIKGLLHLAGSGAIPAALIFIAASFLVGYLLGGPGQDNRRTLGLMSGARNGSICLVIANQVFGDPKMTLMIITSGILMLFLLLPAAVVFGRRSAEQSVKV
jgi:bile acid:Na+ symporter, BASS family